jgi:NAD(P)-dependent dehydrogenase (short-subunit alcohol dehydrogenase family)
MASVPIQSERRLQENIAMKMTGKTVLITGSTDGVGRYVAAKLAAAGANVLIHGRDQARAKALADEIRREGHGEATFYQADLSSLAGARNLAETVIARHKRLDVFISNAGIGSMSPGSERQLSADGHELRFAVNYLSGFLLARLLLPLLKASAPSRIVNVASLGQHPLDFDDIMLTKGYTGTRAYAQSKLAQIMFTIDLAQELDGTGVTANALHPATYMNTTMVREGGITPISTVEQGGEAILHLADGDDMAGKTGMFFNGMQPSKANPQAYDSAARQRLRTLSLQLAGLPAG